MPYVQVALDVPLPALFDYAWPVLAAGESLVAEQIIGRRVIVPFGRRNVTGLALSVSADSAFDAARIKPLLAVLDDIAPLPPVWLALMRFCAGYYQHPPGAAALSALPQGLKSGKALDPLLTTRLPGRARRQRGRNASTSRRGWRRGCKGGRYSAAN